MLAVIEMKNDKQMFDILEHFSEVTGVHVSVEEVESYKSEVCEAIEMSTDALLDPDTRQAEVDKTSIDVTHVFLKHMQIAARRLPKGTYVVTCTGCNLMVTDNLENCDSPDVSVLGCGEEPCR